MRKEGTGGRPPVRAEIVLGTQETSTRKALLSRV
jgi:hypothetical protein